MSRCLARTIHESDQGVVRIVGIEERGRIRSLSRLVLLPSGDAELESPWRPTPRSTLLLNRIEALCRHRGVATLDVQAIDDRAGDALEASGYRRVADSVLHVGRLARWRDEPETDLNLREARARQDDEFDRILEEAFSSADDPATRAEASRVCDTAALLDQAFPDSRQSWVASTSGQPVGVLGLDFSEGSVELLGVVPSAPDRSSVVDRLAREALRRLAAAGVDEAYAVSNDGDAASQQLQDRHGLTYTARSPRYRLALAA